MIFTSNGITDQEPIPEDYAMGIYDEENHATFGPNRNPDFQWEDLPEDALSLVIICHDPEVPTSGDNVNVEGETVSADLERMTYYHWLLVDIDPSLGGIPEGEFSDGVTEGGKDGPDAPMGTRQGVNDYTNWFEGDPEMEGTYFGYDGPFPPWNDELVHHYHFTCYALDVEEAPVSGEFTGQELLEAIEGHILDQARITGLYKLNPDVDY